MAKVWIRTPMAEVAASRISAAFCSTGSRPTGVPVGEQDQRAMWLCARERLAVENRAGLARAERAAMFWMESLSLCRVRRRSRRAGSQRRITLRAAQKDHDSDPGCASGRGARSAGWRGDRRPGPSRPCRCICAADSAVAGGPGLSACGRSCRCGSHRRPRAGRVRHVDRGDEVVAILAAAPATDPRPPAPRTARSRPHRPAGCISSQILSSARERAE